MGTVVTLTGSGFTGAIRVALGRATARFTVVSDARIRLVVPAGAVSGPIGVTTSGGSALSPGSFVVTADPPPDPAKAITAFSFAGLDPPVSGVIDEAARTIALSVSTSTDLSALVATFTTTGTAVSVDGLPQVSGFTVNDFTSPVVHRITAADSSTQDDLVTVTPAPGGIKIGDHYGGVVVAYILLPGDKGYVPGDTRGLIAAEEDAGDVKWNLVSTPATYSSGTEVGTGFVNTETIIRVQGGDQRAQATYAAGVARLYYGGDFYDWYLPSKDELARLYQNRGAIGGFKLKWYWTSTEAPTNTANFWRNAWAMAFSVPSRVYLSATVGPCMVRPIRWFAITPQKSITAFSFQGVNPPVLAKIDETAHTMQMVVRAGTDVKTLVATFTTTGHYVSVGGARQVSGQTANDFTNTVTYTVHAPDGTAQDYAVTVLYIGKGYEGGRIAYFLQHGEPGYSAHYVHGYFATAADLPAEYPWSNNETRLGGTGDWLRDGKSNTYKIAAQPGAGTCAASACLSLNQGGCQDRYLPSVVEMYKLVENQAALGGWKNGGRNHYWTSSELYSDTAYYRTLVDLGGDVKKRTLLSVRPIRNF